MYQVLTSDCYTRPALRLAHDKTEMNERSVTSSLRSSKAAILSSFLLICSALLSGQPVISGLTVSPDPGNDLIRWVEFDLSSPAGAWLSYELDGSGGPSERSEVFPPATEHRIPLLALRENSNYSFSIQLFDATGNYPADGPYTMSTGSLTASLGGTVGYFAEPGLEHNGLISVKLLSKPILQAYDREGHIVWYQSIETPPTWINCNSMQYSRQGTILVTTCDSVWEYDTDGQVLAEFGIASMSNFRPHHDLVLDDDGNFLVLGAEERSVDRSSVGGDSDSRMIGDAIKLFDRDGNQLWYWTSFDHLDPLGEIDSSTYWWPLYGANAIDWTHGNTVSYDLDGNILYSSKTLDQIIKIDAVTGNILWTAGRDGSLNIGALDRFGSQHAIHRSADGRYLVFDNEGLDSLSRAISFEISGSDVNTLREYELPQSLFTAIGGSAYLDTSDQRILVCATTPQQAFEVDEQDSIIWSVELLSNLYRAYRINRIYTDPELSTTVAPGFFCFDQEQPLMAEPSGGWYSSSDLNIQLDMDDQPYVLLDQLGTQEVTYHYGWMEKTYKLEVFVCTGQEEVTTPQIEIFPQPSREYFVIRSAEKLTWSLMDMQGRLLQSGQSTGGDHRVNWLTDVPGIYLLQLETGSGIEQRLITRQ